jgi:hypothetical protein
MVMEATRRHAELHAILMQRHAALYQANAQRVIALSNNLLRKADANWLDENGDAIYVRDLRNRNCELFDELEVAHKQIEELQAAIKDYEHKPAVQIAKRLFAIVDAMPRPLAEPVRSLARWARKAL